MLVDAPWQTRQSASAVLDEDRRSRLDGWRYCKGCGVLKDGNAALNLGLLVAKRLKRMLVSARMHDGDSDGDGCFDSGDDKGGVSTT